MSVCLPRARIALLVALFWLNLGLHAQEGELDKSPPKGMTSEQVIQRFTAKEKEWKNVREQYTFRQTVKQQALDGENELGEYKALHPEKKVAPYAVNQICHASNDRLMKDMETCVKHQVPIIITSLRPPLEIVEAAHSYGGVVFHDVINVKHARKAADRADDGTPALVPKNWELIRRQGSTEEVIAKGVLCYDLYSDGAVLYSNGSGIYRVDQKGSVERLAKDALIEQVVAVEE